MKARKQYSVDEMIRGFELANERTVRATLSNLLKPEDFIGATDNAFHRQTLERLSINNKATYTFALQGLNCIEIFLGESVVKKILELPSKYCAFTALMDIRIVKKTLKTQAEFHKLEVVDVQKSIIEQFLINYVLLAFPSKPTASLLMTGLQIGIEYSLLESIHDSFRSRVVENATAFH